MGKLGVIAVGGGGCITTFHFQCPVLALARPPSAREARRWFGQTRWWLWKERRPVAWLEIDLGSQVRNPQVNAVEKQAQQVSPLGFRLTAHALLWVLTSEWDTPGEGPVIGCHPVTRVLCRLGLLSLPLQNSVSSVREWVLQDPEPGRRQRWACCRRMCDSLCAENKGQCSSHCTWKELPGLSLLFVAFWY